jgi:hypothetical protein
MKPKTEEKHTKHHKPKKNTQNTHKTQTQNERSQKSFFHFFYCYHTHHHWDCYYHQVDMCNHSSTYHKRRGLPPTRPSLQSPQKKLKLHALFVKGVVV